MSNEKINKEQDFEPVGETKKEGKGSKIINWVKNHPKWTLGIGISAVGVVGIIVNDTARNAVIGGVKAGVGKVRGMVSKKSQQIEGATAEVAEAPVAEGMTPADRPQYEGGRERRNYRNDFNNRFERNFNNNQNN